MSASDISDCGDYFSGHTHSVAIVVSSHVVGDDAEEWSQRFGTPACAGVEAISDSLDMVAQVAVRDGQARARFVARSSRSR